MADQKFISAANLFGWGQSINATGKFPLIAKRVWKTYADMLAFVSDTSDVCPAGVVLTVINDTDAKKNGAYFVASCPTLDEPNLPVKVEKIGSGEVLSATNYAAAKALAKADMRGTLIYVSEDTDEGTKGFYIVSGDQDIQKLGTAPATGDISTDVANLKTDVNTLKGGVDVEGSVDNKIATALETIDLEPYATIEYVDNNFVKSEGYVAYTQSEKDKLAGIASGAQANVIEKVIFNGQEVVADSQTKTITLTTPQDVVRGLVDGEKVLSLNSESGKLGTTLSMEYFRDSADNNKAKLRLKGIDGAQIGDAIDVSDFVKDGMLTDVDLVENPEGKTGTFLRFQWNTDSNLDPVITDLDVTKLIDVYVAGDGVAIDGKTIKAKVAANDAYLEVTTEGIRSKGIDGAITSAKNAVIGTTDDASGLSTIYGAKKYADEKVAEVNKSLESYKVLDIVETPTYDAIRLTNTNSELDISVNMSDIGHDLVSAGHISGTNIMVNKSVLGSETSAPIADVLTLLETDTIKSIKSVTGDSYLTPVVSTADSVTSLQLSLNTSKLVSDIVDTNSALAVKDGKITIEWEDVQ